MSAQIDPRLLYQSLLVETDREANEEYTVDPQMMLYNTRYAAQNNVTGYSQRISSVPFSTITEEEENEIAVVPESEIDSLAVPVQNQPNFVDSTSIVIIDTAQRDWTAQPDTYSNTFSFINPTITSTGPQPYYFNNPVIPFAAYDFPDINSGAFTRNAPIYVPNIRPQLIDPSAGGIATLNQQFLKKGLLANTWGWRLVYDGNTGNLKHFNAADPSSYIQPNDRVVYFPTFDSGSSKGQLIGTDPAINTLASNKIAFGTQLALTNVKSLKLARATLPMRRFDSFDPIIYGDASANFTTGTILNTFHSEPYILMTINNLTGQYYGAAPVVHNSFSALVQQQRSLIESTNSTVLAQYQDYYPWSAEAYTFDPPLAQLSNTTIALSNSTGQPFTHLDDLNSTILIFGQSGRSLTGQISFLITRDRGNPVIDMSAAFVCNWFFASNDVRPGDQMVFYPRVVSQIQSDPSCSPVISNLFNYMQNNGMVVTNVTLTSNTTIPIVDVAYTFDAVIKTTGVNDTYALYSNCFAQIATDPNIPVFYGITGQLSKFNGLKYISLVASNYLVAPDIGVITLRDTFSPNAYYPLPMLNKNCQVTYAFEVVTSEADTASLKKIVPTK